MYQWLAAIGFFFCTLTQHGYGSGMEESHKTKHEIAVFGMGCFWCGAAAFADHDTHIKFPGIIAVRSGYGGGSIPNPVYENHEGYKEVVQVTFDPSVITYKALLDIFWHNVDPLDDKGQFCDKGFPYTAVIFYTSDAQKQQALASKEAVASQLNHPVATDIFPFTTYVDAEEYHQDYNIKNPLRYKYYSWNCGRAQRLEKIWGKGVFIPHETQ